MISSNNLGSLMGAPVHGADDEKIGTVAQLFVDPEDGHPNWITVHTGLFGRHESFVPLHEATWDHEVLHVAYTKQLIRDAPRIDAHEALQPEDESKLYEHYALRDSQGDPSAASGVDDDQSGEQKPHNSHTYGHRGETHENGTEARVADGHGPEGEGAMNASGNVVAGARLRKYVITEEQTLTVPITREEVRLEPAPGEHGSGIVADSSEDNPKHRA
ncbi:MAG: photosystem reaction center subunit [Homoserinimonas sp.]|jgi:hypothetical protein|nr:photosystem reaction center subunit [Homoserinimonas sp.]